MLIPWICFVFKFYFSSINRNKIASLEISKNYLNSTLVQLIVVINLNKIDKESNSYTLSIDHSLRYFSVDLQFVDFTGRSTTLSNSFIINISKSVLC